MGGSRGLVVLGRGGDVAGGGRCSLGALGGRGWVGRGRGGGVGGAMSPGSACMVVLAWCGRVWAVVADWAAGFGCCGTVVVVGAGGAVRRCLACLLFSKHLYGVLSGAFQDLLYQNPKS